MNKKQLIIGGAVLAVIFFWIILARGGKKPQPVVDNVNPKSATARQLYATAEQLKKNRDMIKAREVYKEILRNHPDTGNIDTVQKELEEINMNIIFSNVPVPDRTVTHTVVTGDTLGKLAKKYGSTIDLIKRTNNLRNDIIRIGQKLRIWTGKFNIHVDKSQNVLILKDGNEVVKLYRVSTGEDSSTPVGEFKITTKLVDPVWFNRGVVVPPESPENVLGTRWLGFDYPGYGIHGTIDPNSIGTQITAGCVRMLNRDVEELYSMVPTGTQVVIVD